MSASTRIAWIGVGNMGKGMTKNLVQKGSFAKPLLLYNRTKATAEAHAAEIGDIKVVDSIEEAVAGADIIFTCLGVDDSVTSTLETATKGDVKGKLFVDCSTIHPDTTEKLSNLVQHQGGRFVACPVFGAPAMAVAGQLICVLAGAPEDTAKVLPYCSGVTGRANIDLSGQPPSKATLLKVIGNTFIMSMVSTLAEGHVLAEKSGLGPENLHKFIELLFPGPYEAYSKRMLSGDYYKRESPLFAVDLARKDTGHAMKLAADAGTSLKITETADQYLATVKEEMGERGDIASIYGAKRKQAGLDFNN